MWNGKQHPWYGAVDMRWIVLMNVIGQKLEELRKQSQANDKADD
jgi:hypothetical protein